MNKHYAEVKYLKSEVFNDFRFFVICSCGQKIHPYSFKQAADDKCNEHNYWHYIKN